MPSLVNRNKGTANYYQAAEVRNSLHILYNSPLKYTATVHCW